ncbi:HK97 family phage prohead protease, partial [Megamonas funiformis]
MRIFFINNELSIQVRQFYLLGQVIITLTMNTNDKGLRISADIIDTNNGTDVYKLIKRGDVNKMSFAFTVKSERTEVDKENKIYTRTI